MDPVSSSGDLNGGAIALLVVLVVLVIFVIVTLAKSVRIVPQAVAMLVERLGRYSRTLDAGMHLLVPYVDRIRARVDLREQVVSFPPQPVITSDNLVVEIDSVIYFQVTNPMAAVYEIANYITAIEQLTVTTLRNVIGSMDLEQTLTSRDQINGQLRGVLDEATGRWGIRVNRVELKAIDPPASVKDSMEKQMKAERDRRATILTAEGVKQSQILTAEGDKQSAILRAEGEAQSAILKAQGDSRAILQVFDAIHKGDADPKLLAYQYLQMLPQVAQGPASKLWIVPAEFTSALQGLGRAFGGGSGNDTPGGFWDTADAGPSDGGQARPDLAAELGENAFANVTLDDPSVALKEARGAAADATSDAESAGTGTGQPADRSVEVGQAPGMGAHAAPAHAAPPQSAPVPPVPAVPVQPIPPAAPAMPAQGAPGAPASPYAPQPPAPGQQPPAYPPQR
ncbi:MAG: SPFH/Band 7/PHB domain protein [Bifidobacteriaceae bacterium]|jgi:regulator of protease activity HflC (stomatin/prohibitin superfamily)|nr:SPFH/Band 7/PHB domain protein [Bifidobacteriaceae bacterium]